MTTNEIRAAVATRLAGVEGIGRVYDYVLVGDIESRKGDLLDAAGVLHVWMVEPGPTVTNRDASKTMVSVAMHAYREVREGGANEHAFTDLSDAVRAAFAERLTVDGEVMDSDSCNVSEVGHKEWAGVLCHYRQFIVLVTVPGNF